jgi:hypothetical protein
MQPTMQSHTMPRALAATAVIVAAGLVLLLRSPGDDPRIDVAESTLPPSPAAAPAPTTADSPGAPSVEAPAVVKVRELEAMSETFRNTTFLIAIRDAGFVCNELLRVYGGMDESAKWMATCSEMLAYTLGVADTGDLRVEPFLQYQDGVPWGPRLEQGDGLTPVPPPRVEPQLLEPQPR